MFDAAIPILLGIAGFVRAGRARRARIERNQAPAEPAADFVGLGLTLIGLGRLYARLTADGEPASEPVH